MARDYKNSPKRSTRSGGRSAGSVFTGIVIGLLMGIILALGITLYLNRSASPFANHKPPQPAPKKVVEAKKPEPVKPLESVDAPTVAKPAEKPRFDFYEILPGDKDPSRRTAEKTPPPEKTVKETPPPTPKAPETKTATAPVSKETYYLQAGAFRSASDADNLKARLALMGLEANVAPAELPNVGKMYRVRLGPYKSDQVASKKSQLSQSGIQASVVKSPATQHN
ncbi:MAG TPA: SPOR domain-containing protein [Burkholderiales bacterium]|nr:SPOR domain-containing protein [Burkholderiales bacterium]